MGKLSYNDKLPSDAVADLSLPGYAVHVSQCGRLDCGLS